MKYILLFLLMTTSCFAELWVNYDVSTNKILNKYVGDGYKYGICGFNNTNIAEGWLLEPDLSGLSGIPVKYLKQSGGAVVEMTQAEKDAVDAEELAEANQAIATSIDNLDISIKDAFIAWLQVYNAKVPVAYQVTPAELKAKVLENAGL